VQRDCMRKPGVQEQEEGEARRMLEAMAELA
jgi:hypothetical protein